MSTPVSGPIARLRDSGATVSTLLGHNPRGGHWHYGITFKSTLHTVRAFERLPFNDELFLARAAKPNLSNDKRVIVSATDADACATVLDRVLAAAVGYPDQPGPTVAGLLAEFDAWREDRADLSAAEGEGVYPDSDTWASSDDTGCDLAQRLAERLRTLTAAIATQAAEWHKASDECDPGRESNDSTEDCEGTAMAGVYTDAAHALEALIA